MTRREAFARADQIMLALREETDQGERLALAYELDDITPTILEGTRVVQWPEDRAGRRAFYRYASATLGLLGEMAALLSFVSAIGCVALMLSL